MAASMEGVEALFEELPELTMAIVEEELGCTYEQARGALRRLVENGRAAKLRPGVYVAATAPARDVALSTPEGPGQRVTRPPPPCTGDGQGMTALQLAQRLAELKEEEAEIVSELRKFRR